MTPCLLRGGVGHRREESGQQEEEGGSPHGIADGEGDSLECFAWVAVGGSASSKWGRASRMHAGGVDFRGGRGNKCGPQMHTLLGPDQIHALLDLGQIHTLLDPGQIHTSVPVPSTEPAHARSRVIKLHALGR